MLSGIHPAWGHDSFKLFKKLPQNVQDDVFARYKDRTRKAAATFLEDLSQVSSYFVDFRYSYENSEGWSANLAIIWDVVEPLHNAVLALSPDLRGALD